MKLSTRFVKDYVDIDVDIKTLAEDMTKAGNEYDSAGNLINATNLVVGEVLECEMHPDSDHLHVCKVNVGKEVLQIVCGAPNVRKGLKVIVALVGAELPGDFKIKAGKIRGVESNGMLCSIAELGLDSKFLKPEDKEGIHELPQEAKVGEDPIKLMQMDDSVIDFELTANRGDLLSILGMAHEIAAIYDKKVKDIDLTHSENGEDINNNFKVEVNTENCSIFLAKKVENVVIKESPTFIKNRLIASGIRPINNVVDISNYVMLETGQPLHYYDADTLKGMLEVRMAKENEKWAQELLNDINGGLKIVNLRKNAYADKTLAGLDLRIGGKVYKIILSQKGILQKKEEKSFAAFPLKEDDIKNLKPQEEEFLVERLAEKEGLSPQLWAYYLLMGKKDKARELNAEQVAKVLSAK